MRTLLFMLVLVGSQTATSDQVAYAEGYRTWAHVKSTMVGPIHKNFATLGGVQHIYANEAAITGYRTRNFPEGSVITFDWLELTENNGAFAEGPRRQLDVMVKDSKRFASTGGWGFQRFVKDRSRPSINSQSSGLLRLSRSLEERRSGIEHFASVEVTFDPGSLCI